MLTILIISTIFYSCEKTGVEPDQDEWIEVNGYIPFPESNTVWKERNEYFNTNLGDTTSGYTIISYKTYSDSSINSKEYTGIFKDEVAVNIHFGDTTRYETENELIGWFRQDVSGKKVYFLERNSNMEEVLYDFDLEVGDTVKSALMNSETGVVSCIDSIKLRTRYHKIYWIRINQMDDSGCLIEGIGNKLGFLESIPEYSYACSNKLTEFEYRDSIYFSCEDLPVSLLCYE